MGGAKVEVTTFEKRQLRTTVRVGSLVSLCLHRPCCAGERCAERKEGTLEQDKEGRKERKEEKKGRKKRKEARKKRKKGRKEERMEVRRDGRREGKKGKCLCEPRSVVTHVCLSCVAHLFFVEESTECHVQLRSAQHAPSSRAWHPMVPDTHHLLGSTTKGPRVLLSPVCLFFDRTAEYCVRCSRAVRMKAQTAVLPHLHGEGP